jgi:cell division protein FtsB
MSKLNKSKYLLGSILFIFLSVSFVRSAFEVLKSKDRLDEVNTEVKELENKKAEIEEDIEYKKSDEYIEEKARDELNLIKPGEKVYVVTGGDDSSENVLSETDIAEEVGRERSNWYSWYRLFFDD